MLVFNTFFPLNTKVSTQEIIDIANLWIRESPKYSLKMDLESYIGKDNYQAKNSNEFFEVISCTNEDKQYVGIKFDFQENSKLWTTEIAVKKDDYFSYCSIKIYLQSKIIIEAPQNVNRPYIIKLFDEYIGFGKDGEFSVSSKPVFLNESDTEEAAKIINGQVNANMPFLYISKPSTPDYDYYIDPQKIANLLCGMAHVYVEPNRYFSYDLQKKTQGKNPYSGALGIFFPQSSYSIKILPKFAEIENRQLFKNIYLQIKESLTLALIPSDISYAEVKNLITKEKLESENYNSQDLLDRASKEINEKNDQIVKYKDEIWQLKSKLLSLNSYSNQQDAILNIKSSIESFQGQSLDIVIELLDKHKSDYQEGSKARQIIENIILCNPINGRRNEISSHIKNILRGYTKISSTVESELKKLGLEVEKAGKHYKVYFSSQKDFKSILPSTGSDIRGGLNCASDIIKKLL